ncbi:hypothetical protein [Gulosibacter molinativorax]|uniref:Uncharacterized protein n=1 Tax=Gulosibacter molinativorax TaxID=256821 RepID=A0ABT7CAL2_9MICO|nr:hypothetical protein [Gulosibacter molinativorax]MDJ1372197.1 hypothetical protein [Gulosibacter molinativorax]QUY60931.1 Hypotetical protein [Gulosibacter molinativorax]
MQKSLAELRELAQIERDSIIEGRVRGGEDPAQVFEEIPDTDEYLVLLLRDEELDQRGLTAEYALARLAEQTQQEGAADLRRTANGIDAKLFRGIAREYPQLSRAVWRMLGDVEEVGSLVEPAKSAD